MGGIVMDMNGPRQRQQDVYVQERNHGLFRLQKVTSAEFVLSIKRRLNIFETKLYPRIPNRKDAESVSLTQRNGGESAFARKRRESLSHRYPAGIRKGFCKIQNI
jgi:hypothetical protein